MLAAIGYGRPSDQGLHFLFVSADVELAGDGGGDEGGTVFAKEVDSGAHLLGGLLGLHRRLIELPTDRVLLLKLWERNCKPAQLGSVRACEIGRLNRCRGEVVAPV